MRILIVGGGSAGFLTAITLKTKVPALDVTVLRSSQIPIIGVGEGTTSPVPNFLHADLKIPVQDFLRQARPTYKLGIKFLWGPRPSFCFPFKAQFSGRYTGLARDNGFYCQESMDYAGSDSGLMQHDKAFECTPDGEPIVRNTHAYHLENETFVKYLESRAAQVGVNITDETIDRVEQDDSGITALLAESGRKYTADLFVDCSGFASLLLGKALHEPFDSFSKALFCDRAVVGGWKRQADEVIQPYTVAETMDAGWAWRIDHEERINRGYVYSSAFISDEDADREFRQKNPRIAQSRIVRFIAGAYRRGWVKNVVSVGNSAGFVEPLEATSIAIICWQARNIANSLTNLTCAPGPGIALAYNKWQERRWTLVRNFLAIHYKFNTRLDTPFWRACRNDVDLGEAAEFVEFYKHSGPDSYWSRTYVDGSQIYELEGHLNLMIGMKVPYKDTYMPSTDDLARWENLRMQYRAKALTGMGVAQSIAHLSRPESAWPDNFYQPIG